MRLVANMAYKCPEVQNLTVGVCTCAYACLWLWTCLTCVCALAHVHVRVCLCRQRARLHKHTHARAHTTVQPSHPPTQRHLGGLPAVLNHCNIDGHHPMLREWGVFAVRNLCAANRENQKAIEDLELQVSVRVRAYLRLSVCPSVCPSFRPSICLSS